MLDAGHRIVCPHQFALMLGKLLTEAFLRLGRTLERIERRMPVRGFLLELESFGESC
jgi:hypothetical protein